LVRTLPAESRFRLLRALEETAAENGIAETGSLLEAAMDLQAEDLDTFLNLHFIDKNRDLRSIPPIAKEPYLTNYSRTQFQPLLDALAKGDFSLAAHLTPEGLQLCGYQEFRTPYTVEERGNGWAGQYCSTVVPPGIYPVFASKFAFHQAQNLYTNQLSDYSGLLTWLDGECIASSDQRSDCPYPNVVCGSPYAHAVAKSILDGNGFIHLLDPFEAKAVHFQYEGETHTSYQIRDSSLPDVLPENPLSLRAHHLHACHSLDEQLGIAASKTHALTSAPDNTRIR